MPTFEESSLNTQPQLGEAAALPESREGGDLKEEVKQLKQSIADLASWAQDLSERINQPVAVTQPSVSESETGIGTPAEESFSQITPEPSQSEQPIESTSTPTPAPAPWNSTETAVFTPVTVEPTPVAEVAPSEPPWAPSAEPEVTPAATTEPSVSPAETAPISTPTPEPTKVETSPWPDLSGFRYPGTTTTLPSPVVESTPISELAPESAPKKPGTSLFEKFKSLSQKG